MLKLGRRVAPRELSEGVTWRAWQRRGEGAKGYE